MTSCHLRNRMDRSLKSIEDASDRRHKSWCIHCSRTLLGRSTNRDHVPSQSLLSRPFPTQLPVVEICTECNVGFSLDEQYFVAFLGAVLSGSTDPESQRSEVAARTLAGNPALQARIEASKKEYRTLGGETRISWIPDDERIKRVVVKNARGHAYYELGEPMLDDPIFVKAIPLASMTSEEREDFFSLQGISGWPEAGSRLMSRLVTGDDFEDGWIVVQREHYRYHIDHNGGIRVRAIIAEYLATEVVWD